MGKKNAERIASRKRHLEEKEANKEEKKTRRRTNFDFDIWADEEDDSKLPSKEWVEKEALIHTLKGKSKHTPKASSKRNFSTGSLLPAVEVPHAGASYNPSAEEHQELLLKATMVELAKERFSSPSFRISRARSCHQLSTAALRRCDPIGAA